MKPLPIQANFYQQHDADLSLDVPAEGYGGWRRANITINPQRTALVLMHVWDVGTPQQYPGWHRVVEFFSRSTPICRDVFPPLLQAVRRSPLRVMHVVGGGPSRMHEKHPGYQRAARLSPEPPPRCRQIESDPILDALRRQRDEWTTGAHNAADIRRGFGEMADFPPEARPLDHEDIAQTTAQLFALCEQAGINHLIYIGFAINWCLLLSPGGMVDMSRHGLMCSTIRQAVTAVENRETARQEWCKQVALWRVATSFGFVFDLPDVLSALAAHGG
jgi:hypothetical protein